MPIYLTFYFWLLLISTVVFVLERARPWRRNQDIVRDHFVQDLFWMVFNYQYFSWMLAIAAVKTVSWLNAAFFHFGFPAPDTLRLVAHWSLWLQFVAVFVIRDFLEWNIHRTLHIVPWLWSFHKLHHSIKELDWLASFRVHWFEVIVYKVVVYIPLVVLGVDKRVIFASVVISLLIQELSHANIKWDWGPFRYLVNSPRFHAWHHAVEMHGKGGQNFGVSLAIWDWLFRTAHYPRKIESPPSYGFEGIETYPKGIWGRFWAPFIYKSKASAPQSSKGEDAKKKAV